MHCSSPHHCLQNSAECDLFREDDIRGREGDRFSERYTGYREEYIDWEEYRGSPRSSATPAMVTSSSPPPMASASPAPDVPGLGPPGVQLGRHTGQAGHHQEPKKFEKLRQKLEDNIKEERKQKKFVFVHRNKEERSKKIEEYPEVQKTEDEVKSFNSNQSLTTP